MPTKTKELTPPLHKALIEAYAREYPCYEKYADVLERVLKAACRASFPEAMVQARAKSVSSFAEKVARRWPDHEFTDLCGARVIVQTTDQVRGVREFIDDNFKIHEADDKEIRLGSDRFGYRDMHYIVQLPPGRNLGISQQERKEIGERKAEIQVRTWVQHAWADTLHDRMYKGKLEASPPMVRTGNLLAALMEEGDRVFCRLANDLDGMIANYTAHAPRAEVLKQIGIQRLILANELEDKKKPGLALGLARLLAGAGDHKGIVTVLEPYLRTRDPLRCELLLQLGQSLCAVHRANPESRPYALGVRCLEEVRGMCEARPVPFAPNLRMRDSLHARVFSSLGWALDGIDSQRGKAGECYRRAHEHEPGNPYHLANMLGKDVVFPYSANLPCSMRPALRAGLDTCLGHVAAGIELPQSAFTAGRLALLLDEEQPGKPDEAHYAKRALQYYARGIHHVLAGTHCAPADAIKREREWLNGLHDKDKPIPLQHVPANDLLVLAEMIRKGTRPARAQAKSVRPVLAKIAGPVLIVAGGAENIDAKVLRQVRPHLAKALEDFCGTVIAGGTREGIPGCVGDVAEELRRRHKKLFHLVGYQPDLLPKKATRHDGYDDPVAIGTDFTAEQLIQTWWDILAGGIHPREVMLLGFGGGPLSALDYRLALGLGAQVGVVRGTGESVDTILANPIWSELPNLLPLPLDAATWRAFVLPAKRARYSVEGMAEEIHCRYLKDKQGDLPANMQPWKKLNEDLRNSNRQQASYMVRILETEGFRVGKPTGKTAPVTKFTPSEIERMAELEHGRWVVERLANGWRLGPRDDKRKLHLALVPWKELPEETRNYDRNAVRAFPEVLAVQGLVITRPRAKTSPARR
ncbi:MAG: hypothetical protein JXP73_15985 [Deltaproteobacteria bacterium]|nr:hypothetical protein [Deltaproteobacteria bacterium]